jgi:intracellular sulfur oxidation DsrE/DsrF family protein
MGKNLIDLTLQIVMMGGLVGVLALLVAPFINFGTKPLVYTPTQHVLEISDSLANTRQMVIGRIGKLLAQDNQGMKIEVVAVGSGINVLLRESKLAREIESLIARGVGFTACELALTSLSKSIGHGIDLVGGVKRVPDGHRYAESLKDEGYIDELL